jgi:hypothetical protein
LQANSKILSKICETQTEMKESSPKTVKIFLIASQTARVYLTLVLRGNKYVTTDRRKILFA